MNILRPGYIGLREGGKPGPFVARNQAPRRFQLTLVCQTFRRSKKQARQPQELLEGAESLVKMGDLLH